MKTPTPRGFPRASALAGAIPPTSAQLREDAKHWSWKPENRQRKPSAATALRAAALFAELLELVSAERK